MAKAKKKAASKVIKPGKNVTAPRADSFRKKLLKVLGEKNRELDIDFSTVDTVDSVGLGIIIAAHNSLKNVGGNLRLINVPEEILGIFETTGLDQHFVVRRPE
ncbi:MAG: STAS domain-containing protein [Thermodesulfobacteriota bacterium]|nr:STAS domain-containing protein [Thermodesulfobacteriota bacterium]